MPRSLTRQDIHQDLLETLNTLPTEYACSGLKIIDGNEASSAYPCDKFLRKAYDNCNAWTKGNACRQQPLTIT